MRSEIFEQPDVVARTLSREASAAKKLGALLRERRVRFATIAARGTSDNAALLGKYCFEWGLGVPVALAAPSVTTLYHRTPASRESLVLGISQSGQSPDVVECVRDARKAGALTIAITNRADSPLARTAAHALLCHAGEERSVAATKTFAAEAACLYALAASWMGGPKGRAIQVRLEKSPEDLRAALETDAAIEDMARAHRGMDRCFVLGRGFMFPVVLETALKLKESAGIFAEGMSGADFLHGPVTLALRQARDPKAAAFLLAPRDAGLRFMTELARTLKRSRARLLGFSAKRGLIGGRGEEIFFPRDVPGWLAPLPWAVLAQLTAHRFALQKGLDPDRPAGLEKVTRTL